MVKLKLGYFTKFETTLPEDLIVGIDGGKPIKRHDSTEHASLAQSVDRCCGIV